jgi:hypothetical protein
MNGMCTLEDTKMRPETVRSWIRNSLAGVPILVLWIVGSEKEARAYADPGTGAMVLQMLAAALAGSFFYVRKFTTWLKPGKKKDSEE